MRKFGATLALLTAAGSDWRCRMVCAIASDEAYASRTHVHVCMVAIL